MMVSFRHSENSIWLMVLHWRAKGWGYHGTMVPAKEDMFRSSEATLKHSRVTGREGLIKRVFTQIVLAGVVGGTSFATGFTFNMY